MVGIARKMLAALLLVACTAASSAAGTGHALLIGVSGYDNPAIRPLLGPRNDIPLLWSSLRALGFAPAKMRILADGLAEGGDQPRTHALPVRAEIIAGLTHLAAVAKKDDLVVIHFSGHGTSQPELDPDGSREPEPGGRDQVLLPRDAGIYDPATRQIVNGIVDDDFGRLLDAIRATGATVWVSIDACHAGTVTRSGEAASRSVPPASLGVPAPQWRSASRTSPDHRALVPARPGPGALIGFYAVDAWSEAIERDFRHHPGDHHARYGVFSWHLARALNSGRARTFRDLAQIVALDMAASPGLAAAPPPLFDGALEHPLPGAATTGAGRHIAEPAPEGYRLLAGQLHGFDEGAEVLLYDGPAPEAAMIGRGVIAESGPASALLRPAQPASKPQPVWVALSAPGLALRTTLRIEGGTASEAATAQALLRQAMAPQADGRPALSIEPVTSGAADLVLAIRDGRLHDVQGQATTMPLDGAPETVAALRAVLARHVRLAGLIRLAGAAERADAAQQDVDVTLHRLRYPLAVPVEESCSGRGAPALLQPVTSGISAAVGHCDQIRLTVANGGDRDVDLAVFFIAPGGTVTVPVKDWLATGCTQYLPARAGKPLTLRTTLRWPAGQPASASGLHRIIVLALPRQGPVPPDLCHFVAPVERPAPDLRTAGRQRGFRALLLGQGHADQRLRASNPFEGGDEDRGIAVRQFVLDLLPPAPR